MLSTQRKGLLLMVSLVLMMVVMIAGCGPTSEPEQVFPETPVEVETEVVKTEEPEATPPVTPLAQIIPSPVNVVEVESLEFFQAPLPKEDYKPPQAIVFAKDYFLVTGYEGQVHCAMNAVLSLMEVGPEGLQVTLVDTFEFVMRLQRCEEPSDELKEWLGLERRERLHLWYTEEVVGECPGLPAFEGNVDDDLVMNLYQVKPIHVGDEPLTAWMVAQLNQFVYADLVYATGDVNGLPYIAEGGGVWPPHRLVLEPATRQASPEEIFETQLAFEKIELPSRKNWPTEYPTGEGVWVGVFDAAPVDLPFDWLMTVEAPELPRYVFPGGSPTAAANLGDHGVSVAGLIHEVAPASQIQLYRVLNEELVGDLFTLNAALHAFISDTVAYSPPLGGAVINLSLGIRVPSPAWLVAMAEVGELDQDPPRPEVKDVQDKQWQHPIMSMKILLSTAHCQDMVVVTAAGNWRYGFYTPAVLHESIAVEACNMDGVRSCFSSFGVGKRVLAPGGDGIGNCDYPLDECDEYMDGRCPYGLIGPILDENNQVSYAYWSGTSFSAPLVSGLAALLLNEGRSFEVSEDLTQMTVQYWTSSDQVANSIIESAAEHERFINIPAAIAQLAGTLPP